MKKLNEMKKIDLNINFNELEIEEVELFLQEGSKGLPEYAASCCRPSPAPNEDPDIIVNFCGDLGSCSR